MQTKKSISLNRLRANPRLQFIIFFILIAFGLAFFLTMLFLVAGWRSLYLWAWILGAIAIEVLLLWKLLGKPW